MFGYSWSASAFLTIFLTAFAVCEEDSSFFEQITYFIEKACFLCFGPALCIFSIMGFLNEPTLTYFCMPHGLSEIRDPANICLLVIGTTIGIIVLCIYSLDKTNTMAETDFTDNESLFF